MDQLPLFVPPTLSVTEITRYLRQLLESDDVLQDVWVQGEVSNLARPASGHLYFTLKDTTAALKCVMWRTQAQRLLVPLQNGALIEAHGSISLYERDGQYQLYADAVRLAGEGALYQEFLRLKARLEAEGLFAEERKRPLPERPARLGVVTSPTGAALQDMLRTLQRRYPLAEVILAPCAVQGAEAPPEIVRALHALNRLPEPPEVIVLARGGGSLEDLWAFNDERVVRAITGSDIPVITGVGHETDFTLSDFAADLRAPTPTAAAELATPELAEIRLELANAIRRLNDLLETSLGERRETLERARERLTRAAPGYRIQNDRQRLDDLLARANRSVIHLLTLHRARLHGAQQRLNALNPRAVLRRGYALVAQADGTLVHSVSQTQPGDVLHLTLTDGGLQIRVERQIPQTEKPDAQNRKDSH